MRMYLNGSQMARGARINCTLLLRPSIPSTEHLFLLGLNQIPLPYDLHHTPL